LQIQYRWEGGIGDGSVTNRYHFLAALSTQNIDKNNLGYAQRTCYFPYGLVYSSARRMYAVIAHSKLQSFGLEEAVSRLPATDEMNLGEIFMLSPELHVLFDNMTYASGWKVRICPIGTILHNYSLPSVFFLLLSMLHTVSHLHHQFTLPNPSSFKMCRKGYSS
jgi:hypothetical protein